MSLPEKQYRAIPYGLTDFVRIREKNLLYIDKTAFIPALERAGAFLFLIRPRRFGKSLHMVMLETYYDLHWKERFDELFKGTWIHGRPTEERGSFLILKFNFSEVDPDPEKVRPSFEENISNTLKSFIRKYSFLPVRELEEDLNSCTGSYSKLRSFLSSMTRLGQKLYVMIDEYDNFANTVLSTHGEQQYTAITHGEGFLRLFFNILKGGTTAAGAGISRLFITGVSPLVMDDVTSGFNIGYNISREPEFNEMVGFSREEVQSILDQYREAGVIKEENDTLFEIMDTWYNGYLLSEEASTRMFNTDMVLYFLKKYIPGRKIPKDLIDPNIKIDYGKLRHLIVLDRRLNGNFSQLKKIVETGETSADLIESFSLQELINPDNFISLLYYFGLLTPRGRERGKIILQVPNRTIKEFFFRYLIESYKDVEIFKIEMLTLYNLMAEMAYDGKWRALFDYLAGEIKNQTRIRDYISGEKMIQGFFLAYLNLPGHYTVYSEYELNKGYSDLYLEPFFCRYPDMPLSYLIELKYLPRNEYSPEKLPSIVKEAEAQLAGYTKDPALKHRMGDTSVRRLVIVFAGWEMVYAEEVV